MDNKSPVKIEPIFFLALSIVMYIAVGCDIAQPRKKFKLAIAEKDYFYNYISSHLEPFLESKGYAIYVVKSENSIDAVRLVASGEADLTFVNNHSVPLSEQIGTESGRLRTVLPITTRLFFAFSKNLMPDTSTAKELFENKRVGLEVLHGEAQLNFELFLKRANINGTQLVTFDDHPDVIVFWGTFYGARASRFLREGWHPFSFKPNWIEFLTLNNPALRPYTLPSVPGNRRSIRINTIATEAVLVTNQQIGENAIYELAQVLFQNKLELMHKDIMYQSIDESFSQQSLLFPLHLGTTAYLRRDQPTFFERYADAIALVFSVVAVLYGLVQAVRNKLARRKKEQVDLYFLDFLEIRSDKDLSVEQKVKKLDGLFQRAVEQMTNEKLDKSDFHILSRLIQQELTMIKFQSD